MAIVLNARKYRELKIFELKKMVEREGINANMVIVQVGNNQASNKYVSKKLELSVEVGIKASVVKFPETATNSDVIMKIAELNADESITGIMVQLPLPAHLCEYNIINSIKPEKDVDCLTAANLGEIFNMNWKTLLPCTPKGILNLLSFYGITWSGKDVVIVGRSNIVGASLGLAMTKLGATVTICHSKTKDLASKTREADIVITAIGRPKYFTSEYFAPTAIVIDVGINIDPITNKLCGDVDFEDVAPHVAAISPVPNGIGLTTVCGLMENTIDLAR